LPCVLDMTGEIVPTITNDDDAFAYARPVAVREGSLRRTRETPKNYDALIAEHIRTKGVTMCPAGVASPTTATIPEAVRLFHEMRDLGALDSPLVRRARETAKRRAVIGNERNRDRCEGLIRLARRFSWPSS
jgi:hypothetical protein